MGNRCVVEVRPTGVQLYTHWGGDATETDVANTLARRERWQDPEYLARMLFDEMKGGNFGSTGYGICGGDFNTDLVVDVSRQEVKLDGEWYTFEEYVDEYATGSSKAKRAAAAFDGAAEAVGVSVVIYDPIKDHRLARDGVADIETEWGKTNTITLRYPAESGRADETMQGRGVTIESVEVSRL